MNDRKVIYLDDAIDAIHKCTDYYIGNLPTMIDKADAYKALDALPSAQPGIKEMVVDIGYLRDWYQSSVLDDEWPDRYIEEVYHDFYLIPKQE